MKLDLKLPPLFKPSYSCPPVKAPSPITAITLKFSLFISLAFANPVAKEIETEEWPVLNWS